MRRQVGVVVTLGVVLGIAITAVPGAAARWWKPTRSVQPTARATSFCIAGEYTGQLEGWITVSGSRFFVSPNATILEIGSGRQLPIGTMLTAQRVTLSGVMRGDTPLVKLATVRPFRGGGSYVTDESRYVGVLSPSAPQ